MQQETSLLARYVQKIYTYFEKSRKMNRESISSIIHYFLVLFLMVFLFWQTEAPLLVRPFLSHVTLSELHAIMTGGFATIAGGVLAAYIEFGVSPSHLLSASVMSAPAALAISKLLYPETESPETLDEDIDLPQG